MIPFIAILSSVLRISDFCQSYLLIVFVTPFYQSNGQLHRLSSRNLISKTKVKP
jgi:hypothetical protein